MKKLKIKEMNKKEKKAQYFCRDFFDISKFVFLVFVVKYF